MKLERLVTRNVAVVGRSDTLNDAIQKMWKLKIRHLPVVSLGVPVGMVSERDVLLHASWHEPHEGDDPGHDVILARMTAVEEFMTSPAIVLSLEDSVEKAARLMLNKRISAIPLMAGESVFGIVTETDLLRCFTMENGLLPTPGCRQRSVVDHMSAQVFSVSSDEATLSAIRTMRAKQLRHLPVIDNGELIGILSDRDVLRGNSQPGSERPVSVMSLQVDKHHTVYNIMSREVEVLDLSATLADAASKMVENKSGSVLIADGKRVVGIITETDLLRTFSAESI